MHLKTILHCGIFDLLFSTRQNGTVIRKCPEGVRKINLLIDFKSFFETTTLIRAITSLIRMKKRQHKKSIFRDRQWYLVRFMRQQYSISMRMMKKDNENESFIIVS